MKYIIYCYIPKVKDNEEEEIKWNTEITMIIAETRDEQAAIGICKALNNEFGAYYYYEVE